MSAQLEIVIIAVVVAVACALPGVFLILRRMSLMSDAISHAILVGIVLAFFVTRDLGSPLLLVAAAGTGVLTVTLVELLLRSRLVREDAAIGLVFPALFSIGVILIARYAGDVHLDIDAVLLGELAFAPFQRVVIAGADIGPRALYVMGCILIVNALFIGIFYKEMKLTTFDASLAAALGFSPVLIHYAFMSLVSLTAVGAFDAVGSILVVALMIAPPCCAYLLTDRLSSMLWLSATFGAASAVSGYAVAHALDASIAGSMAGMSGVLFLLTFAVAPERGLVAQLRRRPRQRAEFARKMLVIHLQNHEGTPEAARECALEHLHEHLNWSIADARRVAADASRRGLVSVADGEGEGDGEGEMLLLTAPGRELAAQTLRQMT
jgi:manganese/zinc/iron transport system permease protein